MGGGLVVNDVFSSFLLPSYFIEGLSTCVDTLSKSDHCDLLHSS